MTYDFTLYQAAEAADETFSLLLEAEYGSNACNMRYQPDKWKNPELRRAAEVKHAADSRWLDEMSKGH
jgi:hypothetical protein